VLEFFLVVVLKIYRATGRTIRDSTRIYLRALRLAPILSLQQAYLTGLHSVLYKSDC